MCHEQYVGAPVLLVDVRIVFGVGLEVERSERGVVGGDAGGGGGQVVVAEVLLQQVRVRRELHALVVATTLKRKGQYVS